MLAARRKSRRHRSRWRPLSYRLARRGLTPDGLRLPPANSRAGIAVRAALSRLGRPYVWGATGPDRFDCSGLTQWSYARAGIHLDRTTYQQLYDGIPVPRSHVRPGDLVFPSAGHVQMAIGNNLVVEAPHGGATVRISPLGTGVQIRRPRGNGDGCRASTRSVRSSHDRAGRAVDRRDRGEQAALSTQHSAATDADRVLAEALASAHAATAEGIRRLDAIATEIDGAVTNQAALGLDTAIGAREFQKFLIAKQREILAVVSDARELNGAKKAVLEKLSEHYTASAG